MDDANDRRAQNDDPLRGSTWIAHEGEALHPDVARLFAESGIPFGEKTDGYWQENRLYDLPKNGSPARLIDPAFPPKAVYKSVPEEFADAFSTGQIRIAGLRSYGDIESSRVDPNEATSLNHVSINTGNERISPKDRALLQSLGAVVGEDVSSFVLRAKFHYSWFNAYCFCASTSPECDDEETARQPLFEISDFLAFALHLSWSVPQLHGKTPIPGLVDYRERAVDAVASGVERPNPFVKPPAFAWEREARVIWVPATYEDVPAVVHQVPPLRNLINRVR